MSNEAQFLRRYPEAVGRYLQAFNGVHFNGPTELSVILSFSCYYSLYNLLNSLFFHRDFGRCFQIGDFFQFGRSEKNINPDERNVGLEFEFLKTRL